jgi:diguanylate cyclase (GGDEF)-like protein
MGQTAGPIVELRALAAWLGVRAEDLQRAPRAIVDGLLRRYADEQHTAVLHGELVTLLGGLRAAATTDYLTQLPNRRWLEHHLRASMAIARASHSHVAVMLADVDGFKVVNDRFGHEGGDSVLRDVAARLKAAVRHQDFVGRWGGDEFLVVCSGVPEEMAESIASKIEERVEREPFAVAGSSIHIRVTVGWSVANSGSTSASIKAADASMYRRKSLRGAAANQAAKIGGGRRGRRASSDAPRSSVGPRARSSR